MAPIVVKGAFQRKVFFPRGQWKHYFTGEEIKSDGGLWRIADCPLGTPCAYKRVGGNETQKDVVNHFKFG